MVEIVESPNYAEAFRRYIEENYGRSREEIEAIWFKDNEGCYPEEYIGEDLMNDIINKFYEPLDFVRHLLEKEGIVKPFDIKITVMPSYEDATVYTVTYKGEVVLEEGIRKAWHFWFGSDKEFNEWVEETLREWMKKIKMGTVKILMSWQEFLKQHPEVKEQYNAILQSEEYEYNPEPLEDFINKLIERDFDGHPFWERAEEYGERAWRLVGRRYCVIVWDEGNGWFVPLGVEIYVRQFEYVRG